MNEQALQLNADCWNDIAEQFFGATALPEYGPFLPTEDELQLLPDVTGKTVVELGCGSGHSLVYMAERGAAKLYGIDLAAKQVTTALELVRERNVANVQLFCAAMEQRAPIANGEADLVYAIYSLGWTTDLAATLQQVATYLKADGTFIFSWDYPLYRCIDDVDGTIVVNRSYFDEGLHEHPSFRGHRVVMQHFRLGTLLNALAAAGFYLERLIEGDERLRVAEAESTNRYYSLYKAQQVPSSFIVKARKL